MAQRKYVVTLTVAEVGSSTDTELLSVTSCDDDAQVAVYVVSRAASAAILAASSETPAF